MDDDRRARIARVLAPWNEELTGRAKFAMHDALLMADQVLAELSDDLLLADTCDLDTLNENLALRSCVARLVGRWRFGATEWRRLAEEGTPGWQYEPMTDAEIKVMDRYGP